MLVSRLRFFHAFFTSQLFPYTQMTKEKVPDGDTNLRRFTLKKAPTHFPRNLIGTFASAV
jgi:hypothetical protein